MVPGGVEQGTMTTPELLEPLMKQRALAKRLPRPKARELVGKVGRAPRDHLWQDELRRVGQRLVLNLLLILRPHLLS